MLSTAGLKAQQKALLFSDSFDRTASTNLNESTDGQSGPLSPLTYGWQAYNATVDIQNNTLRMDNSASDGAQGGIVYPLHNFTDSAITDDQSFSVTVDLNFSSTGGNRWMSVGVGQSLAELQAVTTNLQATALPADLLVGYKGTLDTLEIYNNGVLNAAESIIGGLPDSPATMRIEYSSVTDFNSGSGVDYAVYFDDDTTAFTSGSFTWSGTDENYISLSANTVAASRFDNLEIRGGSTSDDVTAPTPDPLTWVTVPTATSASEITMTTTNATDVNGVEYYFEETSGSTGGYDSGWQADATFTATGLVAETTYTYTVIARDLSANYNESTTASSAESATTLAVDNTPPNPDPMTWASVPAAVDFQAITMTATTATDAEGNSVEYFFANTTVSDFSHDSGWQSSPTYIDSGLEPNTTYTYTVYARDNSPDGYNSTGVSDPASATTAALVVVPGIIYSETFDGDGSDGLDLAAPTIGTNAWASKGEFVMNDGSINGLQGSAMLPFSPEINEVYTLSMDMTHTGSETLTDRKYLGLGFTKDPINYEQQPAGNRMPSKNALAWIMYGHGGTVVTYEGLNQNNAISNTATYAGDTLVNLAIVIDTTGDGSSFTADFFIDGISIVGGPQTIPLAVDDLNYATLGSYGTNSGNSPAGSVVDNFLLKIASEPTEVGDIAIEISGGTGNFSWYGEDGGTYELQSRGNLAVGGEEAWQTVTTVAGEDADIEITADLDEDQEFFRVKLLTE
jgi:hypothetical protein